jgi:hypothetical protein
MEAGQNIDNQQAPQQAVARRFDLPIFAGIGGLADGIDPLSNRSLIEAAEA